MGVCDLTVSPLSGEVVWPARLGGEGSDSSMVMLAIWKCFENILQVNPTSICKFHVS